MRLQDVLDLWHARVPACPAIRDVTPARRRTLQARVREYGDSAWWTALFDRVTASAFLTGRVPGRDGQSPFRAGLFWLLKPENTAKVLEGHYDDGEPIRAPGAKPNGRGNAAPAADAYRRSDEWCEHDPRCATPDVHALMLLREAS